MSYFFGLVGYPAAHSRSPWIHNHFLDQQQKQGIYRVFETPPDEFASTLKAMRTLQIDGFNVTVPYKERILSFLDEVDPYAKMIGAVNTVHLENGKWIGYNTDGKGFIRSFKESYPRHSFSEMKVLCIGAGGAAKGIYRALVEENTPSVDIANRSQQRAQEMLDLKSSETNTSILTLEEAEEKMSEYDMIVQTTSVGMAPNDKESILSLTHVHPDAVVCDIVYRPMETAFLKEAKERGAHVLYGHGMLLYQAALSYEIWTSSVLKAELLLEKFEQQLKGEEPC
ncbi:shikimate dehydrogenase [Pontibacillus marinus]|uniref:Shikimate dehydrogenase (NADP(+)) n=1 Tax=Pontibacillus marinus BH030004 = DSM 16465 TaxID=1385511 RepID=A0A0A5FVD7_9BACI|nr:shikimate dehydrogenase [Pontibacillus marinus]KGX83884.1 hypothetical protein N783_20745 [Pontibacillus marinus BH030004 = DSM 16465]